MKLFFQRTLQAIVDAELAATSDLTHLRRTLSRTTPQPNYLSQQLRTRLGPITIRMPVIYGLPNLSRLLARYSESEVNFLLLLGRILVRGRASPATVRAMAERLCGRNLDRTRVIEIAAVIDDEIPKYLRRELEHQRE